MEQWFQSIITEMFRLMHKIEPDNFDAWRYRGVDPNSFFFEHHAAYLLHLEAHRSEFFAARGLLEDEYSRTLFDHLILYRLLGHAHVRLPTNTPTMRDARQMTERWRTGESTHQGMYDRLGTYVIPQGDDALCINCSPGNMAANFIIHQYFFNRDGIVIAPSFGDHALDVGACFGDTALTFSHRVGDSGHVYSFDPMPRHCEIIRENLAMNPIHASRITLFEFGLSDREHEGNGRDGVDPGARLSDDLSTRTLDSLGLPRVDFAKMDIEGAESMALRGGEETIRRWRPRLAISLYHRNEDFYTIPLWLNALGINYRFFLDHHSIHQEETVLYVTT